LFRRVFVVLASGDVVARLLGFAAYALLARRLEPSPGVYGALEAALATVFGASLLIEGGLGPYGARSLAARPNDGGRLFAEIARLRLVWTLVSVGALCFYAFRVCDDLRVGSFIALYAAGLLASPFLLEWWFQGRNEPAFVAAPQIGRNLGLFAATFFFVDDASDAYFAPIGDALGFFVGVAVQHAAARVPSPLPHLRETRENLVARAKETAPYLAGTLLWALRIFGPIALSARALSGVDRDVFAAAFRLFTSAHALLVLYFMNQLATWTRGLAAPEASWRTVVGGRALRAFAFAGLPAATAYAAGPGGFEAIARAGRRDAAFVFLGAGRLRRRAWSLRSDRRGPSFDRRRRERRRRRRRRVRPRDACGSVAAGLRARGLGRRALRRSRRPFGRRRDETRPVAAAADDALGLAPIDRAPSSAYVAFNPAPKNGTRRRIETATIATAPKTTRCGQRPCGKSRPKDVACVT
jgi:hypothetical protein